MKANNNSGVCEACGKGGVRLRNHFGKKVCTSCRIMRTACLNRPQVVVAQLLDIGGMSPALPADLAAKCLDVSQLRDEVEGLKRLLHQGEVVW